MPKSAYLLVIDFIDVLQLSIVSVQEPSEKKANPRNEMEQIEYTASHRARVVSRRGMGFQSAVRYWLRWRIKHILAYALKYLI
jgi:hypothetical protein